MSQPRFISWGLQFVGRIQRYFHHEVLRKSAWGEKWCFPVFLLSWSCCLFYGRVYFSVVKAITTPYSQHWDGHWRGHLYPELVQLVGHTTITKCNWDLLKMYTSLHWKLTTKLFSSGIKVLETNDFLVNILNSRTNKWRQILSFPQLVIQCHKRLFSVKLSFIFWLLEII